MSSAFNSTTKLKLRKKFYVKPNRAHVTFENNSEVHVRGATARYRY